MPDSDVVDVLLVEDNEGDARLFKHHVDADRLGELGASIDITHAESLAAAVDVLTPAFDIVFLDLGLPESTGLETLERFTAEQPGLPIVVLTGLDDTETARQAIKVGAQDYLPKDDIETDTLMRSLRYAIERHSQAEQLRERTEQLEFFNSVLRHDVQNGVEVIRRNAQLLARDLEGNEADRAETIIDWSDNVAELSQRVQRMLEAVASEGERDLDVVDLSALVSEQVETVEAMADDVVVDATIADTVAVRADDMLESVVKNLLTNAVDHNDADVAEIDVTVIEDDGTAILRIADNGPGIPESERRRVFGRGEQGARSDGTGFGLYFVDVMVDDYGGTVEVADNEPRGTVFTVELPAV